MNGNQTRTVGQILERPLEGYSLKWGFRDIFYKGAIIFFAAALLFLIVLLKSKTTADFFAEPHLFSTRFS